MANIWKYPTHFCQFMYVYVRISTGAGFLPSSVAKPKPDVIWDENTVVCLGKRVGVGIFILPATWRVVPELTYITKNKVFFWRYHQHPASFLRFFVLLTKPKRPSKQGLAWISTWALFDSQVTLGNTTPSLLDPLDRKFFEVWTWLRRGSTSQGLKKFIVTTMTAM